LRSKAHKALRAAYDLAKRIGAALRTLTVVVPPAAIPGHFVPLPGLEPLEGIDRADALARQELAATQAVAAAVQLLGDGVTVEQQVLFGTDPAEAILEAAASDVDLLVLGSRAYGPVRRTLVGGVSIAVVRHARCPVLVTPRLGP
jgi:nucleotide-binding universal stress UspA family protein